MQSLPWWSIPLLTAAACGFAGAAIAAEPKFPFSILQSSLGGGILGALTGLGVWLFKGRQSPGVVLNVDTPASRWMSTTSHVSLKLFGAGLIMLVLNHLLVVHLNRKLFALVLGGSFFLAIGCLGFFVPILKSDRMQRWWEHVISGIVALSGLGLAAYLWLVVYR